MTCHWKFDFTDLHISLTKRWKKDTKITDFFLHWLSFARNTRWVMPSYLYLNSKLFEWNNMVFCPTAFSEKQIRGSIYYFFLWADQRKKGRSRTLIIFHYIFECSYGTEVLSNQNMYLLFSRIKKMYKTVLQTDSVSILWPNILFLGKFCDFWNE